MSNKAGVGEVRFWLGIVAAGFIGGVVASGATIWASHSLKPPPPVNPQNNLQSPTPALAAIDSIRCPRGLISNVQVRGTEDNFSRLGDEGARIEPSLLRFGSYRDAQEGRARALGLRDYDEGGADKQLIDHFDVPKSAVSGTLVLKFKTAGGGAENDFIRLVPSQTFVTASGAEKLASFSLSVAQAASRFAQTGASNVASIPLEDFTADSKPPNPNNMAAVLNYTGQQASDLQKVTLIVSDDTAIDVAALALCLEPDLVQGVTFAEASDKPLGPNYSVLSCAGDDTQSHCGPYSGDTLCTTELPVACYRDGTNPKPEVVMPGVNLAAFVGGDVRPSKPVAAAQFATRQDADAFCAAEFGAGYRVLSYQEGGGGSVISKGQMPARTRLWIDIRDQPRGRCWDRPASRLVTSAK
jgi:hypothetical protein